MARNRSRKAWRKLTRRDLAQFDDYGVKAVQYAMDHGGLGKVSTRGHVMLKAPDGRIMGVAADTRKARQVIAIGLRDLFGKTDEPEVEAAAPPVDTAMGAAFAAAVEDHVRIECGVPGCTETFVTEGARYSHRQKSHHVCPHPGCDFARDNRGHVTGHYNTKHGEHPRTKARRLREEGIQQDHGQPQPDPVPEPAVEVSAGTPKAPRKPRAVRAREHAEGGDLAEVLRRIDKYLEERRGLEERVTRLEAENAELRSRLEAAAFILQGGAR